ncbi:hypothetical protein B0T20DRAFT_474839 [Sordaria brevicollis]|uniref:Uncharacterized protein n=1 Tax=Sordaria brevicollis TaxID=83679 RepID=A0AAE0PN54_SORBR|nr:hypothetical protein B0T20DRAFT_474839 [Sordaria brevicollis]
MSSGPGFGGFPPGLTDDDDDNNHPWVWVMIPVGLVVVLGGLALCLHIRRRKQFLEKHKSSRASTPARRPSAHQPPTSHSRDGQLRFGVREIDAPSLAVIERDLQESWVRGAPTQRRENIGSSSGTGGGAWGGSRSTAMRRWDWAGIFRPEEGLNELGEAPPPYEKQPATKQGGIQHPDGDLEAGTSSYHGYGNAATTISDTRAGPSSAAHAGVEMRNMAPWEYSTTFSQQSLSSVPLGSQASIQPPPPVHYSHRNGSGIHSQSHLSQPGYSSIGTSLWSASMTQSAATTAPTSPSMTRYPSPSPGHSTIHSPAPEMASQDQVPPPAYEETPPPLVVGTGTNTPLPESTTYGEANLGQPNQPDAADVSTISFPIPASTASPAYEASASEPALRTPSPCNSSSEAGPSQNGNNNATVTHRSPSPSAVPPPY